VTDVVRAGGEMGGVALCGGLLLAVGGCASGITSSDSPGAGRSTSPVSVSASVPTSGGQTGSLSASASAGSGSASAGSATSGPAITVAESSGPLTSSRPPESTSTAGGVHLTADDSGRTITINVGAVVTVELAPYGGSYDPPTVDNISVLRELDHHGGYPSATTAAADFHASSQGIAHITSQTDVPCLHATPRCLPPQRQFSVTIRVV
jgi:hypothetical protein